MNELSQGSTNVSVKKQTINTVGFAVHMVTTATMQLCCWTTMYCIWSHTQYTHGHSCFAIELYLQNRIWTCFSLPIPGLGNKHKWLLTSQNDS